MGSSDRKKERHRIKRRAKQQAHRRRSSAGPYQRIGAGGEVEACLINDDWREKGQAVICTLRGVPGGGHAMATFLVDLWCAGLKDAWGRLEISREDFDEMLEQMEMGTYLRFVPGDLDLVRRILAGSIRFATQNGFRLPRRYERWVSVMGGVGDWKTADLSGFGVDGKLRWVAPMDDLRRRLIGCSVEEFLARPDVEFIAGAEDFSLVDDDSPAVEESIDLARTRALDAVRAWCFAHGEAPHPKLPEVTDLMLDSILQAGAELDEEDDLEDLDSDAAGDNVARFLSMETADAARALGPAIDQFHRFVNDFDTPEAFARAMGMAEPDEED